MILKSTIFDLITSHQHSNLSPWACHLIYIFVSSIVPISFSVIESISSSGQVIHVIYSNDKTNTTHTLVFSSIMQTHKPNTCMHIESILFLTIVSIVQHIHGQNLQTHPKGTYTTTHSSIALANTQLITRISSPELNYYYHHDSFGHFLFVFQIQFKHSLTHISNS